MRADDACSLYNEYEWSEAAATTSIQMPPALNIAPPFVLGVFLQESGRSGDTADTQQPGACRNAERPKNEIELAGWESTR